jgi:hypothetical protein
MRIADPFPFPLDLHPKTSEHSPMRNAHHNIALLTITAALSTLILTGCEVGSGPDDNSSFRISPDRATLTVANPTVSLELVGGIEPFTWRVTDETLGVVSGEGRTVTYTRSDADGVNTVEVTDSRQWLASATITQDGSTALTITPTSATLDSDGDQVAFTGTGGVGPYDWSVANNTRGNVNSDGWSQAVYTRLTAGNNNVIITDTLGHVAIADISQPDVPALAVSPASTSVSTNGGSVIFTAAGGTGAYTWSVASGTGNTSPGTGNSTVYTSPADTADSIIQLTDGLTTVFATVIKQ